MTSSSINTTIKLTGSLRTNNTLNGTLGTGVFIPDEVDPTVPSWVKAITQEDIDRWNFGTGVSINPISDETIEEIVNGFYNPDQNDTTSALGKAILGTMILQ